ncbi:hypothetical protein [Mesorhizobium sp.]|uniref:hypothetical protein n=1 Tax=Mesorhizobium sp. TaxID=1871066 RepID=UPI00257D19DD|nr:hypothetical protein [Mesorhizobium sp.]
MNTTATREERRSALDEFAAKVPPTRQDIVAVSAVASPVHQVYGAQPVAVHRDEGKVLSKIRTLAAAAGEDWYYRFPVKNRKENRVDWIEGPSIKCANDLGRIYGNCEVDCRAQDLGKVVLFHARFLDLETGYSLTRPFQQRKSAAKLGGSDDERREDIAFQIGASKAIRNVTVNALRTFADFAVVEAKGALVDKIGRDIEKWRRNTIERTSARVDIARVEAVIGRPAKDWLAPDIAKVVASMTAVADGMATLDETFPPLTTTTNDASDEARKINTGLDQFAASEPDENPDQVADTSDPGATAGASSPTPSSPGPAVATIQQEAVDKLIQLADDQDLSEQERLENLDGAASNWEAQLPDHRDFLRAVFSHAAKVARGQLKPDVAKKYLGSLIKKGPADGNLGGGK